MAQAEELLAPRIYVACLAAYNSGLLHGAWIDVGDDASEVWDAINAMLKASPIPLAEEHAIHDFDGFGGVEVAEYASIDRVVALAGFLRERGQLGALVLEHFSGDLEAAGAALDDQYAGVFARLSDYFAELTEETVAIPEALRLYIDYDAMAKDACLNGEVFTVETRFDEVHVFWGRSAGPRTP